MDDWLRIQDYQRRIAIGPQRLEALAKEGYIARVQLSPVNGKRANGDETVPNKGPWLYNVRHGHLYLVDLFHGRPPKRRGLCRRDDERASEAEVSAALRAIGK